MTDGFASCDELIFCLQTLREDWLHFGFSPGWSYFLLLNHSSCLLAWIETRICENGGFGFTHVHTCVQGMFSGFAFSNDKYFSKLATYHLPHFLSDPELYTKELIRCLVYRPDYVQSELSSGSVWGLKGLHQ